MEAGAVSGLNKSGGMTPRARSATQEKPLVSAVAHLHHRLNTSTSVDGQDSGESPKTPREPQREVRRISPRDDTLKEPISLDAARANREALCANSSNQLSPDIRLFEPLRRSDSASKPSPLSPRSRGRGVTDVVRDLISGPTPWIETRREKLLLLIKAVEEERVSDSDLGCLQTWVLSLGNSDLEVWRESLPEAKRDPYRGLKGLQSQPVALRLKEFFDQEIEQRRQLQREMSMAVTVMRRIVNGDRNTERAFADFLFAHDQFDGRSLLQFILAVHEYQKADKPARLEIANHIYQTFLAIYNERTSRKSTPKGLYSLLECDNAHLFAAIRQVRRSLKDAEERSAILPQSLFKSCLQLAEERLQALYFGEKPERLSFASSNFSRALARKMREPELERLPKTPLSVSDAVAILKEHFAQTRSGIRTVKQLSKKLSAFDRELLELTRECLCLPKPPKVEKQKQYIHHKAQQVASQLLCRQVKYLVLEGLFEAVEMLDRRRDLACEQVSDSLRSLIFSAFDETAMSVTLSKLFSKEREEIASVVDIVIDESDQKFLKKLGRSKVFSDLTKRAEIFMQDAVLISEAQHRRFAVALSSHPRILKPEDLVRTLCLDGATNFSSLGCGEATILPSDFDEDVAILGLDQKLPAIAAVRTRLVLGAYVKLLHKAWSEFYTISVQPALIVNYFMEKLAQGLDEESLEAGLVDPIVDQVPYLRPMLTLGFGFYSQFTTDVRTALKPLFPNLHDNPVIKASADQSGGQATYHLSEPRHGQNIRATTTKTMLIRAKIEDNEVPLVQFQVKTFAELSLDGELIDGSWDLAKVNVVGNLLDPQEATYIRFALEVLAGKTDLTLEKWMRKQ